MTPPATYRPAQKRLHWAVVALLLVQYLLLDDMGRPFRRTLETGAPAWSTTPVLHMAVGLTVLALALWRLALRLRHGAPPPAADEPALAQRGATVTHVALYALLLGLPLGGLGAWLLGIGTLGELHEIGTTALLWLAGLHVAAVLVHQFWWRTGLLRRMT